MLLALAVWLYATLLSLAYGHALLTLLRRSGRVADPMAPETAVALAGIAIIGTLVTALSLLMPISLGATVIVTSGGLAAWAFARDDFSAGLRAARARVSAVSPVVKLLGAGGSLVVLERSTGTPGVADSGLYHAQAIRWIEQLGIVPGLANLHDRFGIDSAAFRLEALFGLSFIGFGHLHALNGWLCLCLGGFLLLGVDDLLAGRRSATAWAKLLLLACLLPLTAGWISSPMPDLTLAVVLWVAVLLAHEAAEGPGGLTLSSSTLVVAVLVAFALLIKISALPAALLLVPILVAAWRASPRGAVILLSLVCTMLAAGEIRQIVLSGYPLFPFPYLDPFDVDWKVPRPVVTELAGWVLSWARVPGRHPSEVLAMSPAEWLPGWFARLNRTDRALVLAIPLCGSLGALARLGARAPHITGGQLWIGATLAAGVAYWFALAPDPRFGVGFYPLLSALLAAHLARPIFARLPAGVIALAISALLALEVAVLYRARPGALAAFARRPFAPAPYPVQPTGETRGVDFTVAIPDRGDLCWYEPFPCTPYPPTRVELRGTGWGAGFRPSGTAAARGNGAPPVR